MGSYCTAQGIMSSLLGWNMMEDSMEKKRNVCKGMIGSFCSVTEIEGTF